LAARAILLSGSALSPWAIQKEPLYVKKRVAEHTGCHGDLLEDDLAPCLRKKSLSDLLNVTIDSPRFLPGFAPFVDGTVIVNPTSSMTNALILPTGSALASTNGLELADFPSRELLFGLTSIESYLDLSAQDLEFGFNETRRDRILRTYVRNIYHYHLNEIYSALKNEYTDWERPPRNPTGARDATLDILSDGHTAAPLVRLGYMHSLRGGRSYFLHFRHQSGERDFPQVSPLIPSIFLTYRVVAKILH
uniref:Carboxylesterase type B domain-containing protein n=1 Tax=Phlebotomus papatasi TaxID=29031 RepID=A0A1B0DIG6_PHLPP